MREFFRRFAHLTSEVVGSAWAFIVACLVIVVWAATGPMFNWSDTWQLVINTGTTIITFLMVFLIQNMQNRDAKAIHLKLDELIRAVGHARNKLVDLEEMSDEELDALQKEFRRLRTRYEKIAAREEELTSGMQNRQNADTNQPAGQQPAAGGGSTGARPPESRNPGT